VLRDNLEFSISINHLQFIVISSLGAELDTLNAYLGGVWNSELPDCFCETTGPRRVSGSRHGLIL